MLGQAQASQQQQGSIEVAPGSLDTDNVGEIKHGTFLSVSCNISGKHAIAVITFDDDE